jgi:hypothetical protein
MKRPLWIRGGILIGLLTVPLALYGPTTQRLRLLCLSSLASWP